MKEKIKLLSFLILVGFFLAEGVLAVSGACSHHGGVNCAMGRQLNGKVYCNDGWTDSIADYDFMVMCKNYKYECTTLERERISQKYGFGSSEMKAYVSKTQDLIDKMGAIASDAGDTSKSIDYLEFYSLQAEYNSLTSQYDAAMKLIDAECWAIGADRAFKQNYERMQLDFYDTQIKKEQDKLTQLKQEEQQITENYLAELEKLNNLEKSLLQNACLANSTLVGTKCVCNSGYVWSGSSCITYTQSCQSKYGSNSYGDKQYCHCSAGYEWNSSKTACIKNVVCPLNSTKINNTCACNEGYIIKNNKCISHTEDCVQSFGLNVYGTKGSDGNSLCDCNQGYEWNSSQTACIKIQEKPLPAQEEKQSPEEDSEEVLQGVKGLVMEMGEPEEVKTEGRNDNEQQKKEIIRPIFGFLASIYNAIGSIFSIIF